MMGRLERDPASPRSQRWSRNFARNNRSSKGRRLYHRHVALRLRVPPSDRSTMRTLANLEHEANALPLTELLRDTADS
jgi:hypothetical protein